MGVGAALLAGLLYFVLSYLLYASTHESTDDAFIEASSVTVSPKIAGQVSAVHVRDNQWVNQGDVLLEIDPGDYEAKLALKQASTQTAVANRGGAEAGYKLMQTKVSTAEATARQYQADMEAAQAASVRADADMQRGEQLRKDGIISSQDYDALHSAAKQADANLRSAREKLAMQQSAVTEARDTLRAAESFVVTAAAQVQQSQADSKVAVLDLSYTRITAPASGRVTRKSVEAGSYVQIGQSLLAIVPGNVWVLANFKETQLDNVRAGMSVRVRVDAYPEREYRGHVDSIQSGSGAHFSLLPPENAVGTFVKVVQRVPVKILFDETPSGLALGPGMSVVPSVITSNWEVSRTVLILVSVVVATLISLLVAWFLARARAGAE